jgi:hypothetical protein
MKRKETKRRPEKKSQAETGLPSDGAAGLKGRRLVAIRPMTRAEQKRESWDGPTTVIELDDGSLLYPSRDEEGNGPGALFGFVNGKTTIFA